MKKQLISFLTVICLLLTAMPFAVSAQTQTWTMSALEGYYKTQGRVALNGTALEMDTTSSGFEFYFDGSGDVSMNAQVSCSYGTAFYLSVIVDGVTSRMCVETEGGGTVTTKTLTLASGLSDGIHHIEVYKQSEAIVSLMQVNSVTFNGTPLATPPLDTITIEVVGDSLSSGASMWTADSDQSIPADYPFFLDGTKTYAYVAGEAVGANVRVTQASGYGCVDGFNTNGLNLQDLYPYTNYWRSSSALYGFDVPADIVVINLGTNDGMSEKVSEAEFKEGVLNLVDIVKTYNPAAKVVWCMGMMGTYFESTIQAALNEKGGTASGFYYCPLPCGMSGGYSHPNVEEQAAAAAVLEAFLLENVLPADHKSDFASSTELSTVLTKAKAVADPSTTLQTAITMAQAELAFGTTDPYRLGCRVKALNDAMSRVTSFDLMPKKSTAKCPMETNGSYIWPSYNAEEGSVALYKGGEGFYWPKIETLATSQTVNATDLPYVYVRSTGTSYMNIHIIYKDRNNNEQIVKASQLAGNGEEDFSPGDYELYLPLGEYIAANGHADDNGNIVLLACYIFAAGEMDTYTKLYACEISESDGSSKPTAISGNYPIQNGVLYNVTYPTTVESLLYEMNDVAYLTVTDAEGNVVSSTVASGMLVRMTVDGSVVDEVKIAVLGDVNGDGNMTSVDCRRILVSLINGSANEAFFKCCADMDGNGEVSTLDVRTALRLIVDM